MSERMGTKIKKQHDQLKSDYQVSRALDLLKSWEIMKKMGPGKP